MREVLRGESANDVPLPAVTRDECVRIAFAAPPGTEVMLVAAGGDAGEVLAASSSLEGAIAADGPVCFHPRSEPRLSFKGDGGPVRYVVWASP
jgi:hypothetical protein